MTWRRYFCGARNRRGEPCGNPSSDGRGGYCWAHRRQSEERARQRRAAEKAAVSAASQNETEADSAAISHNTPVVAP